MVHQRQQIVTMQVVTRGRVTDLALTEFASVIGDAPESMLQGRDLCPPVQPRSFAAVREHDPWSGSGDLVEKAGAIQAMGRHGRRLSRAGVVDESRRRVELDRREQIDQYARVIRVLAVDLDRRSVGK